MRAWRRLLPALALSALAALALPSRASAAHLKIAFVINSRSASIDEINVDTHHLIREVPVFREPHHMALTPDGHSLIVGDTVGNALFFLDPRTGVLQRYITMSDPYQLVFSPNGKYLTVAGLARNQVDIYDAQTFKLLHRIRADTMPSHLNYSPDSRNVYVSLQVSGQLLAIDTATGQVEWKKRVGNTPAGVLWHDGKLLVGIMGEGHIAEVDPATGDVTGTIPLKPGTHVMFVTHDGKLIYVTDRESGYISVLDAKTLAVLKSVQMPGGPDDMDFAPDGTIWATLRWEHSIALINPDTFAHTAIRVGRSPHGIWLNTHDPKIWQTAVASSK
ncbi:MAG: PQQ-binding-like beta-propeller repeat protein [Proteobacteria bacterium]|nr:PQQ-binding-like beta-propeller repeat protein [Pseudomonadota bacterium]